MKRETLINDLKYYSKKFEFSELSDEQMEAILEPEYAPEDYYQDGEVSHSEARESYAYKLQRVGVRGNNLALALKELT